MQIADHRQGMPMWYYRFTFEQVSYHWPIRDIWNWDRTFRPLIDATGRPSLSYRHSSVNVDDRKRINPYLRVYWRFSNLIHSNGQSRWSDNEGI